MLTEEKLKHTPLHEEHVALGAKMVPFGGWDMPVQYDGILAEYERTRKAVTVFDISHMGEFRIEGDLKTCGLDRIVTMRLSDLPVGASRYGAILNEKGGVIDDLIVFREGQEKWFIVVNASTTEKDAEYFKRHLTTQAKFQDLSSQIGKLDLQGPQSRDILKAYVPDIGRLEYYRFDYFDLLGEKVLISRTGYTGELGYEIFYPWNKTKNLWREILKDGKVTPAGLGARDILRLEVGYSLYGHELGESISPLESGLSRFIDFEKDFIGKEALLDQQKKGIERKIAGIESDSRRSPRAEQKIFSDSGEEIGMVTSGSFSPVMNKGIGLGLVKADKISVGQNIYFGDDKQKNPARIASKIFFKNGSLKN
jgi:aminomethyltransferase